MSPLLLTRTLPNDLTQAQLADIICVTRKTISTVEKKRFIPSTVLELKLARALDMTVEELFMLENEEWFKRECTDKLLRPRQVF